MHKIDWKKYVGDLKIRFGNGVNYLKKIFNKKLSIKKIPLKKISLVKLPLKKYLPQLRFSWGFVLYGVPAFFLLYYSLGAYLSQHIEADVMVEIKKNNSEESGLINAMAYLINKETNEHMWTPNMPIIFPGYVLDNMPEFQTGEISAIANMSRAYAKVMNKHLPAEYNSLSEAAEYLAYSPTVWFFSEKAGKIFAPSSSTQYNKAKKELLHINQAASARQIVFAYNAADLQAILDEVYKDLEKTSEIIKQHIRENSAKFVDYKADNVFYNVKGKIYAYYILLKALGDDYKGIIVDSGAYPTWTSMLKCLENATETDPVIIKNSDLNSSFSPNHLAYLNMYVLCASGQIKALKLTEQEEVF